MNYEIKENDEVIIDGGKRYAVKVPWTKFDGPGDTHTTRVVAEGAKDMGGGWYGAEFVEARKNDAGAWEVEMHVGEEQEAEDGIGFVGVWGWNEKEGVRFFTLAEVTTAEKTDPATRDWPAWFHVAK